MIDLGFYRFLFLRCGESPKIRRPARYVKHFHEGVKHIRILVELLKFALPKIVIPWWFRAVGRSLCPNQSCGRSIPRFFFSRWESGGRTGLLICSIGGTRSVNCFWVRRDERV